MAELPKVQRAEIVANTLRLEFDNGEIRYFELQTQKESQKIVKNWLNASTASWIGAQIDLNDDGSVTINEKRTISAEDLYNKSHEHIGGKKKND